MSLLKNGFGHEAISSSYARIKNDIHETPVMTNASIDAMVGRKLYFKTENFQKTGSFKARGALNALNILTTEARNSALPGVVTHSSGNHGQALAFAAKQYNVPCTVVVPENAPRAKVEAIKNYGAKIEFCASNMNAREQTCNKIVQSTGMALVHPHDDLNIMAGQGTMAMEFLEQVPQLDAILVSVGGGGMISGVAAWVKHAKPECKVYGVEPKGKNLGESLLAGKSLDTDHSTLLQTIADGIRVKCLGNHCFPIVADLCEKQVFSVSDDEIVKAMRLIYERMKLVVEPTAAICLAAAMSEEFSKLPKNLKNIGIVLCGGNVDLSNLPWVNETKL